MMDMLIKDTSAGLDYAMDKLIQAIKGTQAFKNYEKHASQIQQQPELKKQIDEYRLKNYNLQNCMNEDVDLLEEQERFLREYEEFRDRPGVNEFLSAEVEFCRMMQQLNIKIIEGVGFNT